MIRSGLLIAVVGPSGAGKDTILARLKSLLPPAHFVFPTRIISRPADGNEASAYLAADEFPLARRRGDFLIDWEAHGLSYAVPASVRRDLEQGLHVIVNLSRSVPQLLRLKGLPVLVVHVTARGDVLCWSSACACVVANSVRISRHGSRAATRSTGTWKLISASRTMARSTAP